MGHTTHRRALEVIPDDIKNIFEIADITKVLDYFESTFHISRGWRVRYKKELHEASRSISEQEFFCRFVLEHLEPSMKALTLRKGILFPLIRHLLKYKIDEIRERGNAQRNFYKGNEWRTDNYHSL